MKFSTETIKEVKKLLLHDFENQLSKEGNSVDQMEQDLRDCFQSLGQELFGKMLSLQDRKEHESVEQCACKGNLRRTEWKKAKLLTVFGWIEYQRGYYRCPHCGKRTKLLDEEQGLKPGQATRGMERLMALAGVSTSYSEASRQLEEYLQVSVSPNTIRKATMAAGDREQDLEAEMQAKSTGEGLQVREREIEESMIPERLYGSMDGAQTPLKEGWREMKILSWYQTEEDYATKEQKAYDMRYHSAIAPAEEFGKLFWSTGLEALADKARSLIFISDGAAWIWKLVEQYYPAAVQIVDWYHATQYLYPIAETAFDASGEEDKEAWILSVEELLWQGKIEELIAACLVYQDHPNAQEAVHNAVSYFSNNAHRLDYQRFRKQGYLIGSGTIESACKQVVSLRLKRSGARWSQRGAVAVAKARSAWLSGSSHWPVLFSPP